MAREYPKLVFTKAVKATQEGYAVRDRVQRQEEAPIEDTILSAREKSFIEARDSFYVASVLQNGWPYVQHRGGPRGFLKVLDSSTLAFADFRGNMQYVTVGTSRTDDRVALFLMDYGNKKRLKVMARIAFHKANDRPELLAQVEDPNYRGRIERVAVLRIEAFDWNCPQHITQRYSAVEFAELSQKGPQ